MVIAGHGWKTVAMILGFVLVAWMGWRAPNYVMKDTPCWDSGGAMLIADCMHGGRLLYRDVFDHKPPLRFFIMYACMAGDGLGVDTVRYVEKFMAMAKAVLVAVIFVAFTARPVLALAVGMLFVFTMYSPPFFNGGNLSEEYGNFFQLAAMLFCCPFLSQRHPRPSLFLVGFLACCAGLVKEPFLFSCLPWMCFAVYLAVRAGEQWLRSCVYVTAGALAAIVPFFLYFACHGALSDWMYNYIFSIQYSRLPLGEPLGFWEKFTMASSLLTGWEHGLTLCFFLTAPSLINATWRRRRQDFPLAVLLGFCGAMVAAMGVTGRFLPNYRVFLVPSWCLFFGSMIDGILSWPAFPPYGRLLHRLRQRRRLCLLGLACLALLVAAFPVRTLLAYRGIVRWANTAASAIRGIVRWANTAASAIVDGAVRVTVPAGTWHRPETTLDRLLPREIVAREGILLMHQRVMLYYSMHSLLPPTRPFVGISNGYAKLRPDYLEQCLEMLMHDPPALFIGERPTYGYVIDMFTPALEKNYLFLGQFPLWAETPRGTDPDYLKPLYWYIRKDLYPHIDARYATGPEVDVGDGMNASLP